MLSICNLHRTWLDTCVSLVFYLWHSIQQLDYTPTTLVHSFDTAVCCYCRAELSAVYRMSPHHIPGFACTCCKQVVWIWPCESNCETRWKKIISPHVPSVPQCYSETRYRKVWVFHTHASVPGLVTYIYAQCTKSAVVSQRPFLNSGLDSSLPVFPSVQSRQ